MTTRSTSSEKFDIANPSKEAMGIIESHADKLAAALSVGSGYEYIARDCASLAKQFKTRAHCNIPFVDLYYSVFHERDAVKTGNAKAWQENGRHRRFRQAAAIGDKWPTVMSNLDSARTSSFDPDGDDAAVTRKTMPTSPLTENTMKRMFDVCESVQKGEAKYKDFTSAVSSAPVDAVSERASKIRASTKLKNESGIGLRAQAALAGIAGLLNGKGQTEAVVFADKEHETLAAAALVLAAVAYDDGAAQLNDDAKKLYVHKTTDASQPFDHPDVKAAAKKLRGSYGNAKAKDASGDAKQTPALNEKQQELIDLAGGLDEDSFNTMLAALKKRKS